MNLSTAKKKVKKHQHCKLCCYGLTIIPFGQVGNTRKAHVVCPYCYTISLRNVQVLERGLIGHMVRRPMYTPLKYEELKKIKFLESPVFFEPEIVDRPNHLVREGGSEIPSKNLGA